MRIISGKDGGRKLFSPKNKFVRPTEDRVKEAVFNIINYSIRDSIVLDLFSGSGAIGCEFISRGAKKVYFNDLRSDNIKIIKKNINILGYDNSSIVFRSDFRKLLLKLKSKIKFDIIFIDPPYDLLLEYDAMNIIRDLNLLNKDGLIILETSKIPEDIDGYKFIDTRKYGNTVISLLKLEVFDDSDISGQF